MLSRADFPSDPAYLEYLACRSVWGRRDELTPRGQKDGTTWAEWYRRRFGRTLDEARAEYIGMHRQAADS